MKGSISNSCRLTNFFCKINFALVFIGILFFTQPFISQERDSLFSNSLFYNGFYDDGAIIDSQYISNLVNEVETTQGEPKVGLLFKLLNGYYFSNPVLAKDLAQKALDYALPTKNDSLISFAYHYLAVAYIYLDYSMLSNELYRKGLTTTYAKENQDYQSWSSMNMGNNFLKLEQFDSASAYYYRAIKLNETVGDKAFEAKCYVNLSELYSLVNNYEASIANSYKALNLLNLEKEKRVAADVYTVRFKVEFDLGRMDSSEYYFNKALANGLALNDSLLLTQIHQELGGKYLDKKYYAQSKNILTKGLSYCDNQNPQINYYSILHGIAKANLFLGKSGIARNQLLEVESGFSRHKAPEKLQELELTLSQLYAKLGDWEKFNHHFDRSEEYRLAKLKADELRDVNEMKLIYETEQKDNQIHLQEVTIASQEKQIWLIGAVCGVIIIALIGAFNFNKKLKERNKELYQQNLEITQRWKQIQNFYKSNTQSITGNERQSLFASIVQLMNEEKYYKRNDLQVEVIARTLNSNVKYISNAIKDETGMNFNTFVNTYRIENAKTLLLDIKSLDWTLEAIGLECGFNNQTSFYKAFRKNTGLTPSQFRKARAA